MKIRGRFCKKVVAPKSAFNRKSFRWKKSGQAMILVGCPKGEFHNGMCSVGMKAREVLVRSKKHCKVGQSAVKKGR